jgi:hypothetical protein
MKWLVFVSLLLLAFCGYAQKVLTIAPKQPVVVGTAFQVQYIVTDPTNLLNTISPAFDSVKLVSGPNYYKGNTTIDGKSEPIENITYTLVALHTGVVPIKGITAQYKNGSEQKSTDAAITVVFPPQASYNVRSSYTDISLYAPASKADLQKLINENLFIKVNVSKKICYVGEPVVATFKLYSRLQSSSEAVKSPGFYGFSVLDMLDINEAHTAVETINNKVFNTSILRQVQLYPEQASALTIDKMYLHNEIEFDDTTDKNKKTRVEKDLVTNPVIITVKPLPAKQPDFYTGAVGNFTIEAHLEHDKIASNEQGKLLVIVSGKGNFTQFGQPSFQWQRGIDSFDPSITDELNKNTAPISGKRIYVFGFTADSSGSYTLLPISFAFFDAATSSFKTISTDSLRLEVTKAHRDLINVNKAIFQRPANYLWVLIPIALVLMIFFFVFKPAKKKEPEIKIKPVAESKPTYTQLIKSLDLDQLTDKQSCLEFQKILVNFLNEHNLNLTSHQKQEINIIQNDCQLMIYSNLNTEGKKEEMKKRILDLFQSFEE